MQQDFILSECFRGAASAFSMINQQLKRDGYAASIDPSIFIWLASITEPETRDTGTIRLEIVPNHRGRPSTTRARSLNSSGILSRGRAAGDRPHIRGLAEARHSASFAREGLSVLIINMTFFTPRAEKIGDNWRKLTGAPWSVDQAPSPRTGANRPACPAGKRREALRVTTAPSEQPSAAMAGRAEMACRT